VTRSEPIGAPAAASAAERVAQIRDLQLDGRPGTVSRLVVQMPDGAGSLDVSSRGDLLSARIEAHEAALANRLRLHVDELRNGLASRGIQAETLAIRDTQTAELLRALGAPTTASAGQTPQAGSSNAGRDLGGDPGSPNDPGRQPDDAPADRQRREAREQRDRRTS
jgi:hypothetical protein